MTSASRSWMTSRFGVDFIIEGAEVVVLAVLDLRRDVRRRLETLRQRLLRERSRP